MGSPYVRYGDLGGKGNYLEHGNHVSTDGRIQYTPHNFVAGCIINNKYSSETYGSSNIHPYLSRHSKKNKIGMSIRGPWGTLLT
jgi:hypothetical protein